MARLDQRSLETLRLPLARQVSTRFSDLDPLGHVNNVMAGALLQEGRMPFFDLAAQAGLRVMVAAITIEFAREVHHPSVLEIGTGVQRIGRTSFTVAQVARCAGQCVLFAEVTMVVADDGGPRPIAGGLRQALDRLQPHGQVAAQIA